MVWPIGVRPRVGAVATPGAGAAAAEAPAGRATAEGGATLTAARCSTGFGTATAAGAARLELTKALVGTTVAAPRFANRWSTTCGGGSARPGRLTIALVTLASRALPTLVMLTLRKYVGSRV